MLTPEVLYVIKAFILPPGLQFVLLLLAWLLWRSRRRLAMSLALVALFSLYLLSTPLLARQLAAVIETYPALDLTAAGNSEAGAIVILGSGLNHDAPEYGGDTNSARQLERLRYGALLHDRLGLPLLLSGGRVFGDGPAEAEIMQQTLLDSFHQQALWLESRSRNTRENAGMTADMLRERHIDRVILVTHASHMRRAVLRFEQAGIRVIPAPTGFESAAKPSFSAAELLPSAHQLQNSTRVLHELIGILAMRFGF